MMRCPAPVAETAAERESESTQLRARCLGMSLHRYCESADAERLVSVLSHFNEQQH